MQFDFSNNTPNFMLSEILLSQFPSPKSIDKAIIWILWFLMSSGTDKGSIKIFVGIKWEVMLVFVISHSRSTALLTHLIDLYIWSDQIFSFFKRYNKAEFRWIYHSWFSVTTLGWWLYDSDRFEMSVAESLCNTIYVRRLFWSISISTSVTNIDVIT